MDKKDTDFCFLSKDSDYALEDVSKIAVFFC